MSLTEGKIIKCRAAVAWAPEKPLSIETIEVAPPKQHEVRIKIIAAGVCHSDHNYGLFNKNGIFPVIFGHEGAGIVESIGNGVTKFKPGDHVIPLFIPQCYECEACKSSKTNFCQKIENTQRNRVMPDGTTRFTCKGKTIYHFMGCSTFSEYTVVADISLAKINEKAPLNKICLIGCGVATGYGSSLNIAKVEPGSKCAIWGLGTVGLAAVMGCRKAGASKIYGIDINPNKFELAKKFGCTNFISPNDYKNENIEDILIKESNGGFDYTLECIGNVNIMKTAFKSCHPLWGVSVIVGLAPLSAEVSARSIEFLYGRTWTGGLFGGWKSIDSVPVLVEDYMKGELMLDEFVTHSMPLEKINDAFEFMLTGKSIKSVIEI